MMNNKKQRVLIGWPLTPFTGWGSYGIHVAQSLISNTQPILTSRIQVTEMCDLHWKLWASQIEEESKPLLELIKEKSKGVISTNCEVLLEGGNGIEPNKCSKKRVIHSLREAQYQRN